jgi:hypothetical protein
VVLGERKRASGRNLTHRRRQLEDQDQRSRKCTSTQIQRRVNRSQRSRGWLYAPGSSA